MGERTAGGAICAHLKCYAGQAGGHLRPKRPCRLLELLQARGLPADRLDQARQDDTTQQYQAFTREAIERGIFGAPSYVVDGEIFWGQDRLDFLQRRLARG